MRTSLGEKLLSASQSPAKTALAIVLAAFLSGSLELIVMLGLQELKLRPSLGNALDALLMAALGGTIAWLVLTGIRERRTAVLEQIKVAAELNRNVRAALGAILSEQYLPDQEQTNLLIQGVDRIDETLKSLFPAVADEPQGNLLERVLRQETILRVELAKLTGPDADKPTTHSAK